ncbi:DUF7718 family protein [Nocardia cyriacigeorgica]|uniref:DUF7718 domain-containing protein n=1 Tax=Nocardia cyriacigeorgica TaxID=135487 RepID=A0A5R8NME5_9NOCA|nr:hypothetical protein [Nocardia cyriacigeorgica]TLF75797.1 hypothetical protein FEK34_18675 [Nocardia cyriacigeorgica]
MVRRGQQNKRALREASKSAFEQLDSPHGTYAPPDREKCRYRQWDTPVDDLGTVRLQFNIWRANGQIADFVINVQVLTSDGWTSVERVDCCHGHCHLHVDNDDENARSLYKLDGPADVEHAFSRVQVLADQRARIIRDRGA